MLAGLVVGFGLATDHFFTPTTLRTVANQVPDIVFVATGMTFVIIAGGIDLSVGSILALSGAVLGIALADWRLPLGAAFGLAMATGAACGALNGLFVTAWALPSFIVTLGMLEIARGGAYLVTASQTKYIGGAVEVINAPIIAGLSTPFLLALATVTLGQFVLTRTVFGRHLIAVGANPQAAWLSGIDPRPIRFTTFVAAGIASAVAAVAQSARLAAADPNAGTGLELQAIAAVVIGGTSLMGGRGSVVTTFLGVLIIAVLGAGLAQMGVQEPTRRLVTGAVIVAAAIADYYRSRR
ncbi:MAG TPA: ABC transporter permease [Vicinamibacterales bacterium]|nr:ABC transporter permease [Vicinamibacterales bacterium]